MIPGLVILLALFLICVLRVFRRHSIRIIGALLLAGLMIGGVLPYAALRGYAPLPLALGMSLLVVCLGTPLIGGWNRKSLAAGLGAGGALILAAGLSLAVSAHLQLSGLESHFGPRSHLEVKLWYDPLLGKVRFGELLLAAVIMAMVGAVMDVAMVIASSEEQAIRRADGRAFAERFRTGMRVGTSVLGPMVITMLLMFAGIGLIPHVARATVPGGALNWLKMLDYESIASEAVRILSATAGLLFCVPLTAVFAARLLRGPESPPAEHHSSTVTRNSRRKWAGVCLRIAGPMAILLAAVAVEQGFLSSYDSADVTSDYSRARQTQQAIGRVVIVQPPLPVPAEPGAPHNPARESVPDKLVPCAARLLTGVNRGRTVVFVNRVGARPYVNVFLQPGSLAQLSVTTGAGQVEEISVLAPPIRWRVLLWSAALLGAVIIAGLGFAGARTVLLISCTGIILAFVTLPLLAGLWPPAFVILVSFALIAGCMGFFWGVEWRAAASTCFGALAGLATGGAVAFAATRMLGLTGESSAVIRLLRQRPDLHKINFEQLMAAGATLMVMGAALDIAASVVSGLLAFRANRAETSPQEIKAAGTRLHRDMAGMMILTVFFAWLAVRLPVLLIAHGLPEAFGAQWMRCYAMEAVQIVSACIALMLTGPFATLAFSRMFAQKPVTTEAGRQGRRAGAVLMPAFFVLAAALSLVSICRGPFRSLKSPENILPHTERPSVSKLLGLSRESQLAGNWDRSIILLWQARALDPVNPAVHRDLAYAYLSRRWVELARGAIGQALPALANDARGRYICGVLACWENDIEKAEKEFQAALEIDPSLAAAANALSQIR